MWHDSCAEFHACIMPASSQKLIPKVSGGFTGMSGCLRRWIWPRESRLPITSVSRLWKCPARNGPVRDTSLTVGAWKTRLTIKEWSCNGLCELWTRQLQMSELGASC
eukprot:1161345-Pelagomonas_calceolata.AAC.9